MSWWKPGYLYCIYFAYFSICLSEYVISIIYLLCTCVVHRVFVVATFFNNEGVLVLYVSWTKVCITKQTSWCLRVSPRPFENGFNNTKLDYPSRQWWRFWRIGFGCWRSCDSEEDAIKTKGWGEHSHKFEANQSKPNHSNSHPKEISAERNAKQASANKVGPSINGFTMHAFWRDSRVIQRNQSKSWPTLSTTVVEDKSRGDPHKIQYKYASCSFSKVLCRISKQNIHIT